MAKYIYEYKNWTDFSWKDKAINFVFGEVRHLQGKILALMSAVGWSMQEETSLTNLTLDVVKSSEIEGEVLNYDKVRSSIARQLGIEGVEWLSAGRNIEGVVEMILDATQRHEKPLTKERLFGWHNALFPTGMSGSYKIEVAKYRTGEMQIVSGAMGKEKVHYEAVKAEKVEVEMDKFLNWFNNEDTLDPVLKAAIAHFWFIIIHPFDDGNGRIARAITDLQLARADKSKQRFYSMSAQMLNERKQYYDILKKEQYSNGNITEWLSWFLNCLKHALQTTENTIQNVLRKAEFWKLHENTSINERQRIILNMLFDGFEGKLQTSKWAKITKTSTDTALRDIKDLVEKGILQQTNEGGRNVNYKLTEYKLE